jgi:hypothetical protein
MMRFRVPTIERTTLAKSMFATGMWQRNRGCLRPRFREESRSHASDSPMPGEGEDGCLFDEVQNLVEPDERPVMDDRAGLPSHGWRDVVRMARPDEEYWRRAKLKNQH